MHNNIDKSGNHITEVHYCDMIIASDYCEHNLDLHLFAYSIKPAL